jgi:hypothetical protein
MNKFHAISKGIVFVLMVVVASWWVVAPRSYVSFIRKVPWLWMSVYPMNAKSWFPQYLRALGLLLWLGFLGTFLHSYLAR